MNGLLRHAISLTAVAVIAVTSAATAVFAHGPVYSTEKISKYGLRISISMKDGNQNIPVWIKDIKFGAGEDGRLAKVYYTRHSSEGIKNYIDLDSRIFNMPLRINLESADSQGEELFKDLSDKKQVEYITQLHDAGILNGYPDRTFHPEETITRAEFMVMMVKALKLDDNSGSIVSEAEEFSDIEGHWAKSVLLLAVKNGLLKGYEGNLLKPDAPISVGEVSTIISKSFPLEAVNSGNFEGSFSESSGHWSWPYMKKLLQTGIISGADNLTDELNSTDYKDDITSQFGFMKTNPDKPIARGDCAVLLSRAVINK